MLLDTNIIIYATQPAYPQVRALVADPTSAVSLVSYVETLGFPHITPRRSRRWDGS